MKTGSLVTAFVNAYYEKTGVPIVGVSASKGGSSILQWQPDAAFGRDALERFRAADTFLRQQAGERECSVRHRFLLWCQGETDGDHGMSADEYIAYFTKILDAFLKAGIERCFLIQVGNFNADAPPAPYPLPSPAPDYAEIRRAQCMIAERNPAVTMVSTKFEGMLRRGLMKDAFHYFQQAYNEVGTEAGINTADFVLMRPNLNRR